MHLQMVNFPIAPLPCFFSGVVKPCNVLVAMEVTPACEGPGDGNWKALDTGFAQVTGELEVK